jgi:hypothetical protein
MRCNVHEGEWCYEYLRRLENNSIGQTDALRRHQKSRYGILYQNDDNLILLDRHNGIVIEPSDQEPKAVADNEAGTSASHSKSRSPTPSSKGKERASVSSAAAQPERTGPSSYYRQHTAMSTRKLA